jgi:hypothetical protein
LIGWFRRVSIAIGAMLFASHGELRAEEKGIESYLKLPTSRNLQILNSYDDIWQLGRRFHRQLDPWQLLEDPLQTGRRRADMDSSFQALLNRLATPESRSETFRDLSLKGHASGYRIRQVQDSPGLYSKAKIDIPYQGDQRLDFAFRQNWRAEETFRVPLKLDLPIVQDSMFAFGHFNSRGDSFNYSEMNAVARAGVGMRWADFVPNSELQLRGGPQVTYLDTNTSRVVQERPQFAVEVLARLPVLGRWEVEFTGSAISGYLPNDSNQINQDIRFAYPLGKQGEFYIGATQKWSALINGNGTSTGNPWNLSSQLYFGVELKH